MPPKDSRQVLAGLKPAGKGDFSDAQFVLPGQQLLGGLQAAVGQVFGRRKVGDPPAVIGKSAAAEPALRRHFGQRPWMLEVLRE